MVCFLSGIFFIVRGDQKFASVFDCGVKRRRLIKMMKLFPAFRKLITCFGRNHQKTVVKKSRNQHVNHIKIGKCPHYKFVKFEKTLPDIMSNQIF